MLMSERQALKRSFACAEFEQYPGEIEYRLAYPFGDLGFRIAVGFLRLKPR
jgi:hypothetical protein